MTRLELGSIEALRLYAHRLIYPPTLAGEACTGESDLGIHIREGALRAWHRKERRAELLEAGWLVRARMD